jgi:hypothetical protein
MDRNLDRRAMSAIHGGGGAAWVFGAFRAYMPATPSDAGFGGVINVYEVTNNYFAQQMNNQFQSIAISNSAPNSQISLAADQRGINVKQ